MQVISSISSLGISVGGYDESVLAELLREQHADMIFLTEVSPGQTGRENALLSQIETIKEIVKAEFIAVGVDMERYRNARDEFIRLNINTPELSIKKNMLDLIENTISNYLAQYWKGPETVNSEVTDSLFRAKHKLFASVFYQLEAEFWEKRNKEILENIRTAGPTDKSVILSSVESRYWFKDHLSELFS